MAENLEVLRAEIQHDLEVVARNLEEKYVDYIPMFIESYGDVSSKLHDLDELIREKLCNVEKTLNETDVDSIAQSGETLMDDIEAIDSARGLISKMARIEDCFLAIDSTSSDVAEKAMKIIEATNIFQGSLKMITEEPLVEKMSLMLLAHLKHSETLLRAELSNCFNMAISFPSSSSKGVRCMRIAVADRGQFSLVLQSMRTLSMLDTYIEKIVSTVLNDFCACILKSLDGTDVIDIVNSDADVYVFKSRSKSKHPPVTVDGITNVLNTLTEFFTQLDLAFSGIQFEHGCMTMTLAHRVGMDVCEKLMTMIVKQCIAVPVSDNEDGQAFSEKIMEASEIFRLKLIEIGVWSDSVDSFSAFAEKNELILVDRRCLSFLLRGKELIALPLTELQTVGVGMEADKESHADFVTFFSQATVDLKHADLAYPKLLQFLECRVSKSVVQFVDLVESVLQEAAKEDNKAVSSRFALTARNLVQLYIQVAPKLHHTDISNIPLVAAVFYTSSYFLCHNLLMLPFGVLRDFNKSSPEYEDIRPIFGESVWKLRSEAARALEQMLCSYRRQISTILGGSEIFTNLENFENFTACKKTIIGCVELVKAASKAWKDVFPETVYCKAMGNICSYFMSDVCSKFLNAEDLKTSDCEIAVKVIESLLLKDLEDVFIIRGHTAIHSACERDYFRTKEVIFCLKGSLQNISDRWCDAKGPLAQWLKAGELRSLIRATFMNTEQRKRLLESIV